MKKLIAILVVLTLLSVSVIASSPANSSETNAASNVVSSVASDAVSNISISESVVSSNATTITWAGDGSGNEVIITKNYTQEQWDKAEKALSHITASVYLNESSSIYRALRDETAPKEFMDVAFFEYKPDIDTIMPIYKADMFDWVKTGELKIEPKLADGLQAHYLHILDNETGEFTGDKNLYLNGTEWRNGGWAYEKSPFVTRDFFTHRVDIYNIVKDTKLDLVNTTAKAVVFNGVGSGFYFTDGENKYFLVMSYDEDSPLASEENTVSSPDASAHMRIINIEDLKPLAEKQVVLIEKYQKYIDPNDPPMGGGGVIAYGKQIESEQRQAFLEIFIPSAIAAVVILGGGAMLIIKKRKAKMSKQ